MKPEIPEWMEYGICNVCEDLIRIENAYDHEVTVSMQANWHGKTQSKEQEMKDVKLWCSQECKVASSL